MPEAPDAYPARLATPSPHSNAKGRSSATRASRSFRATSLRVPTSPTAPSCTATWCG